LILTVGACGSGGEKQTAATTTTATSPARSALRTAAVLDRIVDGSIDIQQVALDAHGGAWFMFGETLKHLDAAGSVTVVRLPKGFTVIQDTVSPQVVVDPSGTAWVIGQSDLAEVKLGATSAKLIPLGPVPNNARTDGSTHPPVALASDGGGHVAVALDGTSAVRVCNTRSGTFSDVRLPNATDAASLRYFGDGKLAIGLVRIGQPETTAVIASADGSRSQQIEVGDSSLVNPYSDRAVLFGGLHPTILDSDGTTHPVALPAGIRPLSEVGGLQAGRDATLVVPTATGITFLDGASKPAVTATIQYRTGNEPCGPPSGTGSTGTTGAAAQPPTGGCLVRPRVAVAPDGAVWVFNVLPRGTTTHLIVERIDGT